MDLSSLAIQESRLDKDQLETWKGKNVRIFTLV
jgi:hypothetical protein